MGRRDDRRVELGDWQTPAALCDGVLDLVVDRFPEVRSVVEPTCGRGAFLRAARRVYPGAKLIGFDISAAHLEQARDLVGPQAELTRADFFETDWGSTLGGLTGPLLIVGNPPWVTNSTLGTFNGKNLPEKRNRAGTRGFDALTGKSNFDISEWMIWSLVSALRGREFFLAMLCKASVARRLMQHAAEETAPIQGATHRVDARTHFHAAVDAVLLTLTSGGDGKSTSWPVFGGLDASAPLRHMGVVDGRVDE